MVKQKEIWFIINPKSGGKNKAYLPGLIDAHIDKNKFNISLKFTSFAGEATIIAEKAVDAKIDIVCAVGGDGTINEIAQALVNSNTALAVLPMGSGNGLARHLNIPLNTKKALLKINHLTTNKIDVGYINSYFFVGTCGFGFDAHVAYLFDNSKKRGFINYTKIALSEIQAYPSFTAELENEKYSNCMMCTFANSSQFGSGLKIAPSAKIDDGLMDLILVEKVGLWRFILFSIRAYLFKNWDDKSITRKTVDQVHITSKVRLLHVDGEPKQVDYQEVEVKVVSKALRVIV